MNEAGNSIGSIAPDKLYTRAKAARLVGRSPDTLKRWHKSGIATPSARMRAGELLVWLYTDKDIEHLRRVASTQRPGRKPKGVTSV